MTQGSLGVTTSYWLPLFETTGVWFAELLPIEMLAEMFDTGS